MQFSSIIDDLAERGWSVQRAFLPSHETLRLAEECRRREAEGAMVPAAVGRGEGQLVHEGIRGDHILWLEPGQSAASDLYLQLMDGLRQQLNRELYLGLEEFECHFAVYPPGAFYKTHLDRFRDDDSRCVTAVFYLNPDWQPEHGGALRLYLGEAASQDVAPLAGTLAVFMSGDFPHEVLPTAVDRLSVTGWFRRRAALPLSA
ncbi:MULTISPECIES: 2OG-Fe(II) oxygenase [Stutzerimonas]|uniref:2OG-Fe(II) oxygenase n=2 Tax=Stutzerimonas balearica TaxID=74829 RepID=A0A8D3Y4M6_9GAMM|nr:2OG-Fe(II) oxygenase [Stutzerimonas balearica]KIL03466.1 2OG-Fe(II) oxygenase [Stutzerimonas stutzeri]MBZ5754296.1 2OG-Fe(II) oxygenase [Pseudomonas sp. S5(2021)]WIX02786.1 2OG-Fe(II) oxygenase [Pseudomonas sp. AR5]AJE17259.1 2OG-Fe(II) oxygenase [Stutzerimonas balearica DSM 6083]MBC7200610.1 2OG-Fe(II) oxygenase [Stutzerimonas balearica]